MDTYRILIRQSLPSSTGRPTLWRYHTSTGNVIFETEDIGALEAEIRLLLDDNPAPVIDVIKVATFSINVEVE